MSGTPTPGRIQALNNGLTGPCVNLSQFLNTLLAKVLHFLVFQAKTFYCNVSYCVSLATAVEFAVVVVAGVSSCLTNLKSVLVHYYTSMFFDQPAKEDEKGKPSPLKEILMENVILKMGCFMTFLFVQTTRVL